MRELARLMTDVPNRLTTYVVFIRPENESEEWTETGLRESAEAIPNVRVVIDSNNRETGIFNAQTSGLTLLYDREGKLQFDGGITAARGHEGDNPGRLAIAEIVTQKIDKTAETLVFGCPLHNKDCEGELMQHAQ